MSVIGLTREPVGWGELVNPNIEFSALRWGSFLTPTYGLSATIRWAQLFSVINFKILK
jgi:hypothetical protein